MCSYCSTEDGVYREFVVEDFYIDSLNHLTNGKEVIKISYCPMCGRRL